MLTEEEFTDCYHLYYSLLCFKAIEFIKDKEEAENIVQDSFVKLWLRKDKKYTKYHAKSFLFICTVNACRNYIRHIKTIQRHTEEVNKSKEISNEAHLIHLELVNLLNQEIEKLPLRRKESIKASILYGGYGNLKHVAKMLNITVDTIKEHRSKGIKSMRIAFKENYPELFKSK